MPAISKKVDFTIDCTVPAADKVMDVASFEKFLNEHIKVEKKLNNLSDSVAVTRSDNKVCVSTTSPFSKRYLKYLSKKYLKKQQLRDYCRVIAGGKNVYKIVYFNLAKDE